MATEQAAADQRPALVVIGNFDGVHRGHQAVLNTVSSLASERDLQPRLLTFAPHPAATLGRTPPALLTNLSRKKELLQRACPGVDVVVRAFTLEFAQLSPEAFAKQVLAEQLKARVVMVGRNFRFGRGRAGAIGDLEQFGRAFNFEAMSEPLVSDEGGACSSTRIRRFVAEGDMQAAQQMLGRPHMLSGEVVRGAQRGRTLGFPTCNIAAVEQALPPYGVYAVLVDRVVDGQASALGRGVANLGVRPSIKGDGQDQPLLETHLFDLQQDLYGAELRVHLIERLRPEQRFDGLDALKAQIAKDSDAARALLEGREPDERLGGVWA